MEKTKIWRYGYQYWSKLRHPCLHTKRAGICGCLCTPIYVKLKVLIHPHIYSKTIYIHLFFTIWYYEYIYIYINILYIYVHIYRISVLCIVNTCHILGMSWQCFKITMTWLWPPPGTSRDAQGEALQLRVRVWTDFLRLQAVVGKTMKLDG